MFTALLYDRVMAAAEARCLRDWRSQLLAKAEGTVLEIGACTGANLDFYTANVKQLLLTEPDKNMRKHLLAKLAEKNLPHVSVSATAAEQIETQDDTFDFVTSSLVCCSIVDPLIALKEIKRVLKPGGSLIFMEHVAAATGSKRHKWQNRVNPLWRKVAGNCHLNRETEETIRLAGFEISEIKRQSMRIIFPLVRPTIRGLATKPARG